MAGRGRRWAFEEQIPAWVAGEGGRETVVDDEDPDVADPAGLRGAVPDVASICQGALRFRIEAHHGAGRRWRPGGGVPDRFRLSGDARRSRDRSAAEGACADLHRRATPGTCSCGCRSSQTLAAVIAGCEAAWEFFGGVFACSFRTTSRPLSPMLMRSIRSSRRAGWTTPACRVRHRPGPGPVPAGQTRGRTRSCSTCAGTSGPVRHSPTSPTRRPGRSGGAPRRPGCASTAPPAPARWRCSPPTSSPAAAAYRRCLRRAGLQNGEGAPRLPRRGRQSAVLAARAAGSAPSWTPAPTASW